MQSEEADLKRLALNYGLSINLPYPFLLTQDFTNSVYTLESCLFLLRQQIQTIFLLVAAMWNSFLPCHIPFHFKSSLLDTYKIHTSVKSSYQILSFVIDIPL